MSNKYVILNNIKGDLKAVEAILDKESNCIGTIILGNLLGEGDFKELVDFIFRLQCMIPPLAFLIGKEDFRLLKNNNNLHKTAKTWLLRFKPIEYIVKYKLLVINGTVDSPLSGKIYIQNPEEFKIDNSFPCNYVIHGNSGFNRISQINNQLIISPGNVLRGRNNSSNYATMIVDNENINFYLKECIVEDVSL